MTAGQTQQWTYVDDQQMQVRPWEYAESLQLFFMHFFLRPVRFLLVPFFYYYYFNVCKQASIIDEAPFLCRHELMYVFMYDISQMSRCAVYICRRLSIPIIRFVFQDPGETKWGEGGKSEAVSCFRGRKPPLCHNNDFVL